MRVIITSIFYTPRQNVALGGHEENRKNISEMSDTNRGNLLELLHLRCDDHPWLKEKLQSRLNCDTQWTSPSIQNEILDIISSFVIERIIQDVLLSRNFALNLALQDAMNDVEPLRNALGTLQSLYNFLEGSTKQHALFHSFEVDSDHLALTLKSLSDTRCSCRWEAVKAVTEQMSKIVKVLLVFTNDKDKRMYTDSRALINAICDFDFVFGLTLLKVMLLNTNSLGKYLQGKTLTLLLPNVTLTLP